VAAHSGKVVVLLLVFVNGTAMSGTMRTDSGTNTPDLVLRDPPMEPLGVDLWGS